jgi:tetratricopeptide (TPR) repeat protein
MFEPHHSRIRTSYALGLAESGRVEEAHIQFKRALEYDPSSVRGRIGLAKSLCDLDQCFEALTVYRSIHDAGQLQGLLDENIRLTQQTIADEYRRRMALNPDDPALPYSLGVLLVQGERWADSVQHFDEALMLDPNHRHALYNRSAVAVHLGDPQTALDHLNHLLACCSLGDDLDRKARGLRAIAEHNMTP